MRESLAEHAMGTTNLCYRAESLGEGAGWVVLYTNPVTGAETVVWERINEKRAKELARGGNLMMEEILAAAARSYQDDVRAFHAKYGHPQPDELEIPTSAMLRFRGKLIKEEAKESDAALVSLAEWLEAHEAKLDKSNLVAVQSAIGLPETMEKVAKCLAEMADSLYVGFGGFVIFGVSARAVFEKVQEANMSKIPNPNGGKPLKPEGWISPLVKIQEMLK